METEECGCTDQIVCDLCYAKYQAIGRAVVISALGDEILELEEESGALQHTLCKVRT